MPQLGLHPDQGLDRDRAPAASRSSAPRSIGIEVGEPTIRWDWLLERKNKIVKQLTGGVKTLLSGRGVDIHKGTAKLTSANRIVVTSGGSTHRDSRPTRSCSRPAPTRGCRRGSSLDGERVITSKEALDLTKQPKRIAVLGGGVVGCEFACFFAAIGTQVTLIEMLPRLVPAEDDEIAQTLEREMKKQKIDLYLNTKVEDRTRRRRTARSRSRSDRRQDGGRGRACWSRPGAGRIARDWGSRAWASRSRDRGKIVVNDRLQTSVKNIYAIGDVTDIKQLAHFASAQGKAAAELIAGQPAQTNWRAVPAATFTSPEIASVGLTEREARAEGRQLKIGRFPFRAHGRNIADGETDGFVKLIGDASTDQVLGAHIIGAKASELIHECSLAIAADLNISDLAQAIHAHPTLTETLGEAAEDADGHAIHLIRQEARAAAR